MATLKSFAPKHLIPDAEESGFLQCPECRLIWFGRPDIAACPQAPHGRPVHVAILCRVCDVVVPMEHMAAHLTSADHVNAVA